MAGKVSCSLVILWAVVDGCDLEGKGSPSLDHRVPSPLLKFTSSPGLTVDVCKLGEPDNGASFPLLTAVSPAVTLIAEATVGTTFFPTLVGSVRPGGALSG